MHEFQLITQYFTKSSKRKDVELSVGDDCAILVPPKDKILAISCDTLIEGVHFFSDISPQDLGYKSLAISLSDLAAMGAEPAWVMLAVSLPHAKEDWLQAFAQGFFQLADHYDLALVGGDTTQGPLVITSQVFGFLSKDKALKRSSAKVGDLIYVTGTLGDAGLALRLLKEHQSVDPILLQRLNRPEPRIKEGLLLSNFAHAAIDISDGLAADLQHILEQSQVGARIYVEQLPLSNILQKSVAIEVAWELALSAGDDYELCFTIPRSQEHQLVQVMQDIECACTCIGEIEAEPGLKIQRKNGQLIELKSKGYEHFI